MIIVYKVLFDNVTHYNKGKVKTYFLQFYENYHQLGLGKYKPKSYLNTSISTYTRKDLNPLFRKVRFITLEGNLGSDLHK